MRETVRFHIFPVCVAYILTAIICLLVEQCQAILWYGDNAEYPTTTAWDDLSIDKAHLASATRQSTH